MRFLGYAAHEKIRRLFPGIGYVFQRRYIFSYGSKKKTGFARRQLKQTLQGELIHFRMFKTLVSSRSETSMRRLMNLFG